MSFSLTRATRLRSQGVNLEPQLVLKIDGIDTVFGVGKITKYIRIGDEGLFIGNDWVIGGFNLVEDQLDLISFDGTSSTISQQLLQDKGGTGSVSKIQIALLDSNNKATRLITPGLDLEDILGRKSIVYLGYQNTAYPEDFINIFSGIIDEVSSSGLVTISISHPDQKKRQEIFQQAKTELNGAINNSQTTITVNNVAQFILPADSGTLRSYVVIEDEAIEYTGVDEINKQLTGCVRGQLDTFAASHDDDAEVTSLYRLQGNAIDLALKVMLSGLDGPYIENIEAKSLGQLGDGTALSNAIYFDGFDIQVVSGVVAGDTVTITNSVNPSNDYVDALVTSVQLDEGNSYITIDQNFVLEQNSTAKVAFKSQYNVLSEGLSFGSDEVDVAEFLRIRDFAISSLPTYDLYLKDTVDGKEFIDTTLLFPAACYSIPRKGRVSLGFTSPPLAISQLKKFDDTNVARPDKIGIKRSINKYFYNNVVFRYNEDAIEDKFRSGFVVRDEDSIGRIKVGNKVLTIDAGGMRPGPDTESVLNINSRRLLERYKFAAEEIKTTVFYGDSFNAEVGDIVLYGDPNLQISDTKNKKGNRNFSARLFEVINKSMNIKTGEVQFNLLDTNYSLDGRYGIFSPASILGSGSTNSLLTITDSYAFPFGNIEKQKWENYFNFKVVVHNEDWTVAEETLLIGFDPGNPYKMQVTPLSFSPPSGYIVDLVNYPDNDDSDDQDIPKAVHCYVMPSIEVTGIDDFNFDVPALDVDKFIIGNVLLVRDDDWNIISPEVKISLVTGTTITVETSLGFTPGVGYRAELIGFKDLGASYRYL